MKNSMAAEFPDVLMRALLSQIVDFFCKLFSVKQFF